MSVTYWITLAIAGPALVSAQEHSDWQRWRPSVTFQTGVASTFQLTLGGTFGRGPAWQNRVTIDYTGIMLPGDAITMSGWMTLDRPSRNRDWTSSIGYRTPTARIGSGTLVATSSWQRWLFPSVLSGARDHLLATNVTYRAKWKLPVTITADNWALLKSPLRRGHLTHVQASVTHQLWRGKGITLLARHGPSTTYSLNFYDRPGWRVLRYGASLAVQTYGYVLEASWRQQAAIAPRVPDNRYWAVLLSRQF